MRILLLFLSIIYLTSCHPNDSKTSISESIDFNFGWDFFETNQDLNISDIPNQKDWKKIRLPHDWAIKKPYNQAYLVTDSTPNLGSIGWYKKEFTIASENKDKIIRVDFDGIYNNAEVYINGNKVAERPYGFSAFSANLTSFLMFDGQKNLLVVKVDHKAFLDSRWYNGAGIYRDVKLAINNPIHFKKWGIGITTPFVSKEKSTVQVKTEIVNIPKGKNLKILHQLTNHQNQIIKDIETSISNEKSIITIDVDKPKLWSPKHPYLYILTSSIVDETGKVYDIQKEHFGIRSLKYTPNDGFFLNGNKTAIKGVCLHHDAGALGTAVPDAVWRRRIMTLKKGGVNAIRTAHNPPSSNFLNLCDELGLLVQDEAFDEFDYAKDKRKNYNSQGIDALTTGYVTHFQEWAERDLKDMVLRDRNHPSVIMWSIGNEIEWTYPRYAKSSGYFNSGKKYYYDEPPITIDQMKANFKNNPAKKYELAKTAQRLSKWVKDIDTTRPVTANLVIPTIAHFSGYTDALDVVGYSYRASVYDYGHRNYPEKMILGTENWANYVEWKSVIDNPFVPGIFLWTGIFYLGETSDVTERGSDSGLIDFAGFPTPRWHMFKSLWNTEEPEIYATTIELSKSEYINKNGNAVDKTPNLWKKRRWGFQPFNTHWNYTKGDTIVIETYTNCKSAELFINNTSFGTKKLANNEDHIIKWIVPYIEGNLRVVGGGNDAIAFEIKTAKSPSQLEAKCDKKTLKSDAYDVVHIEIQLTDDNGNPITHLEQIISITLEGPAKLLALDNGSNVMKKHPSHSKTSRTHNGKLLVYIQSTKEKGAITLNMASKNCKPSTVHIISE
ncbi:glycoside hydrolase family 2 TIM barrel-domain containing protein [Flavivirga rizhaonensis]|uniref:Glycoside hydrolase family 2 protein n=1 Tax=Flavivirga rizhaonensis TaxID=2559571 RepID=A0A4S1DSA4_9FLAO|nr:glycoside hydrolase family 2 TIM barrel-domain containing protein [Flavivirga rizhaonensis]TGV00807.1 glycoside hydrolase family 2 protein [Flavivirga rizhaonensis]